jgi:hypothetical protein
MNPPAFHHLAPFARGGVKRVIVSAAIALLSVIYRSGAAETVVLDFPLNEDASLSTQFTAPPRQLARFDGEGYAEIYLAPVPEGERLAVTVIFEDTPEESPALFWVDAISGQRTTLSAALSDGISGPNQRTILVSKETTSNEGRLVISGNQSKIKRIRLDWTAPNEVLIASDQGALRLISGGRAFQETELSGDRNLSPPDAWFGEVLEASLQEEPVELKEGVEFVVPLPRQVNQALLRARFLGLPLQDTVEVWINGTDAGEFHPVVPGLSDPGYILENGTTEYSGWRDASIIIPAGLLAEGDNSIVLRSPDSTAYVRDASLQLKAHAITHPTTEGIAIGETQDLAPR